MKKIMGIVLMIAGFMATLRGEILLFNIKSNAASGISIIGGADGPTSIFLAGKIGGPLYGTIIGGIVVLVIGLILIFTKKK